LIALLSLQQAVENASDALKSWGRMHARRLSPSTSIFSPDHNVFVDQTDPEVFERFRQSQTPVIVGVEPSAGGLSEAWLG
jgi:hypothetical protein